MRVTVISHERIGDRMAGPAIRSWEFARSLSTHFSTTLVAPDISTDGAEDFQLLPFAYDDLSSLDRLEEHLCRQADVVISSGHLAAKLPFLCDLPIPWVADVYIPTPVESLAYHVTSDPSLQVKAYEAAWQSTRTLARHADFFICASERQRDFWLGVLTALGRLRPGLYAEDPDVRNLIDVVPFGCSASPPQARSVLKGQWPGIEPGDRIILWGGGVWNWLDPITLIRAMPQVLRRHPEARLLFLGADHPDSVRVPQMKRAQEARSLSRSLGLEDSSIFWGDWVPYEERGAYLLEADLGVSLHRRGLEAHLAFRTRLLDAIWAGLPMVLSPGDVLGEELVRRDVGYIVGYGAVDEVAETIVGLLDEPHPRAARRQAFEDLREAFTWQRVVEPLVRFCHRPRVSVGKREAMDLVDGKDAGTEDQEAALRSEISRLQRIVDGYRSGRVMRLLEALHKLRRRLGLA
jgi:glycosyltransferase involved in cell wall biosynthesis